MDQRAYLTALKHQKRSRNLLAPKRNLSISDKKFDDYKGSYFTIGFNKQTLSRFWDAFKFFVNPPEIWNIIGSFWRMKFYTAYKILQTRK